MANTRPDGTKVENPPLRGLFPDLSEEQLRQVEETFHGYLEIAWRIYRRLEREHPEFFDTLNGSS